jgi:tetratricopeptide (TPR) repeat protein
VPERRENNVIIAAGLALVVAAVFWPATENAFLNYDDTVYVTANPRVTEGLTSDGVVWALTTVHAGNWHPVTWFSHMADVSLFGLDPRAHHRTSVLLHALNAALVFLVLARATRERALAAAAAALFAIHPLRVESVAWVAERKDVLSSAFGLSAILAYVVWTERPSRGRYAAIVALYALSLAAKPMLVTLPVLLLLLDIWPLARRPAFREKLPLVVLALASAAVTLAAQRAGGAIATTEGFPLVARLGNAAVATVTYAVRTVWPSGLAVFYPHPGAALAAGTAAGAALCLAAAGYAAWLNRRRLPFVATGLSWFAVSLLPVIGLVQIGSQAMADRYTYLPSIGLVLVVVWGAASLVPRPAVLAVVGVAALIPLTIATRAQLSYWKDSEAVFARALSVTRGNFVAHVNLGAILRERGDLEGARAHFEEAARIAPRYAKAWYQLGVTHAQAGRPGDAEGAYRRALTLDPGNAEMHFDLGVVLTGANRADEAIAEFALACELDPSLARAHYNWGTTLASQGRYKEAIERFERAIALDPSYPEAHYNLGAAALLTGDLATARREIGIARAQGYEPPPRVMEMLAAPR